MTSCYPDHLRKMLSLRAHGRLYTVKIGNFNLFWTIVILNDNQNYRSSSSIPSCCFIDSAQRVFDFRVPWNRGLFSLGGVNIEVMPVPMSFQITPMGNQFLYELTPVHVTSR